MGRQHIMGHSVSSYKRYTLINLTVIAGANKLVGLNQAKCKIV